MIDMTEEYRRQVIFSLTERIYQKSLAPTSAVNFWKGSDPYRPRR